MLLAYEQDWPWIQTPKSPRTNIGANVDFMVELFRVLDLIGGKILIEIQISFINVELFLTNVRELDRHKYFCSDKGNKYESSSEISTIYLVYNN